jgi:hypothetical protein
MLGETRHRLFQGGSGIFKRPSGHLRTGLRTEPTTTATKR